MSSPHGLAIYSRFVISLTHRTIQTPVHVQTTAVANSAGPDSTCLLFLLLRMINWKQENKVRDGPDLPDTILSLHVNHNLQDDAEKMAYASGKAATRFKAVHSGLRIPWGEPPFPSRPRIGTDAGAGEAIESVARTARYQLMFDAMVRRRVHVLATGHHADDQIETVLMRLGSGSSVLGLGGMRPVRRFGMAMGKDEDNFGWFGHEGLDRWIVRPLLDIPKVRLPSFFWPLLLLLLRERMTDCVR